GRVSASAMFLGLALPLPCPSVSRPSTGPSLTPGLRRPEKTHAMPRHFPMGSRFRGGDAGPMLSTPTLPACLLACLLAAWPPGLAGPATVPTGEPPAIMLPMVLEGDVEVDVAQYLVSEKLDGVRGRWDGQRLWTRGGLPVEAPE